METFILIALIILFIIILISCNLLTPVNQYVSLNNKTPKKQLTQKDIDDIRKKCNLLKKDDESEISNTIQSKGPNVFSDKDYYFLNKNKQEEQLYHIYPNLYTFLDAKKECEKRKGRLATTTEFQNAYELGAEWCNWGWVDDQNAYMPNRSKACNKDMGIINAEVIDPYLRLGVNCYGVPQ